MLAGHDTTALSLSWLLFELSRHPKDQQRIRDEIDAARANIRARGDDDFTISDLENMTFMNACLKVIYDSTNLCKQCH
jgi:cytochrome P450